MQHPFLSVLNGLFYLLGQICVGNFKKFIRPKADKEEVLGDNVRNSLLNCALSFLKSLL